MKRKTITPQDAQSRLEALCARSEQCTGDLQKKLYQWGIAPDVATKIIEGLITRRFVDDQRFASAYTRDKFRFSKWGRLKISKALALKHVNREIIATALSVIDDDEYERTLLDTIRQKAHTMEQPDNFDGKTRLFRFAVSRGFEPSLVISTINSRRWISQD